MLSALVEPNLMHVPEISSVVVGHFADARPDRLNNLFDNAPVELAGLALGEQFRSGPDLGSGKQARMAACFIAHSCARVAL
jgi:hypothetical protein